MATILFDTIGEFWSREKEFVAKRRQRSKEGYATLLMINKCLDCEEVVEATRHLNVSDGCCLMRL